MKAVHLIPYMHPTAGGPPVVADRFCQQLHKLGWEVEIITSNSYARNEDQSWVEDYQSNYEMTVLKSRGPNGFGYSPNLKQTLRDRLKNADIVHIHNLWSYFNLVGSGVCRSLGVPYVVSTHGMLDPHSLSRKAWKKRLYGQLVEWPRLRSAAGMIYTHADEQQLAETQCDGLPTGHVVPLAADPPPQSREALSEIFDRRFPQFQGKTKLLFLGRLHSKKGLDLLIPAMTTISKEIAELELILVGPCEPEYLRSLKNLAIQHSVVGKTHFLGSLSGVEKWSALAAADLFMLPSYQENFAIALVEALRTGTPAVISRRINIWNEVADANAGLVTNLEIQCLSDTVTDILNDRQRLESMSENAEKFASNAFSWSVSGQRLDAVYQELLANDH